MKNVLTTSPKQQLDQYLELCVEHAGADAAALRPIATSTVRHLRGGARDATGPLQALEKEWYRSLIKGAPDYTVYGRLDYLAELWACWVVYSRQHLKGINKLGLVAELGINSILDLGCGPGLTTLGWCEIAPHARITGTNFLDSPQGRLARHLSMSRFELVEVNLRDHDLIFASEYFEHFPEPVAHLEQVFEIARPRAMLIANAFNTKSIGHFPAYTVHGVPIGGPATGRAFDKTMKRLGFRKKKTGLWNERPALWVR